MKVLLTGATGFLGTHLTRHLLAAGHEVLPVSRQSGVGFDWSDESLKRGVEETDVVVNLAGENIFSRRWTRKQKEKLVTSRVENTRRLAGLLSARGRGVLVNASAVGFYGPRTDAPVDESEPSGTDFLAQLCRDWEAAAQSASAGVRVAIVRIGVILGTEDGALKRMLLPFKLGLGGRMGDGRQWVSWVGYRDTVDAFVHAVTSDDARGPMNLVAPNPVTNREFTATLGRVLGRPSFMPLPAFALKAALGEMARDLLLASTRVEPRRLPETGFAFTHPDLEAAIRAS